MSHLSTGLISAYNSLTDKHLAGYFSNTRIRRHLQRAGLITRSGRIVPDKEYRHKLIQRAHQRHVRECLAQAIFHKVLEMERVHQIEIKRKLEEFARRERVHKIKVERSKRYEEDLIRILSPRPPTGARGIRKQHSGPEGEHSESSESPGSSRPNTAPGKMQRPVRLKPIHSNSTTASQRRISPYRHRESSTENNQPFNCTVYRGSRQHFNTMEASNGISPYCLPVINNFVTPVPPPPKRRERGLKVNPSGTLRGRRLRPTTASSGADIIEDPPMLRSSVHQSRVCVNMIYCGKTVHLSHDLSDMRDEVKVFQQHCGGENLCVYKGKLREGEVFQFISRRHRGFPFSLTFFLNGLQVERLSSCCEFKHRKGSRLGGRHGHFGFCSVEGASPCYKCIIAMGLDKKPTPPPKRVKEDRGKEESIITPKEAPEIRTKRSERSGSHSEYETSQPQDVDTQLKETTATEVRDDYEEDFEADDEGPTEDTEAKGKKLPPLCVDMEKMAKKREASDTEDENEKNDIKSHSGSSLSGSEREESDTEATIKEDSKEEQPQEVEEEEPAAPPDEKDDPQPEETPATEAESVVPKDSDVPNSAGESTEINISDTSIPSGNENKQCDDSSGVKEMDEIEHESKQVEEQERAKSVQEKLAEAILKESQRSSEPELSDTSTDDTVESTGRGHDLDHKDAAAAGVKSASTPEKQKSIEEEKTCEEGVVAAALAVAVLDQQNIPEPKQAEDTEQKHQEVSETTKDENGEVDKDKKVALEEEKTPAETNKLDEIETTCATLLAVSTAVTIQNGGTPEAQGDLTDTEKKEEKEEKAVEEAEEKEQEAKSSKEDESSASEPNTETVETAATDNADAEAMTGSGTMEIKAEPSEERAALSCEEAPVTGTETSHLGDNEDRATGTKSEVTEGSGDTAGDKTADTSEKDAKEESVQDIKEEVLALEASEDKRDLREESDQMEDKAEEEEKLTNAGKMAEGEHGEENKEQCEDQTEEEKSNESKTKENTDDISTEEQSDKTHSDEKQFEKVEETGRSEKTENAEDAENKNNEDEVMEEAAAAVILAAAAGAMSETITAADEPKKEQIENKVEQSGTTKTEHHEESQETKVVEVEKSTVKEKDSQNRKDADMDEYGVKTDGNMESEDAANATLLTVATAGMSNTMEADDVAKESEKGGDNSERREVDAENGEESKPQEDEGEAPTVEENGVIAAEGMENEKTEETTERETTAESGDCAEKQENIKSASASDSAEAKEEDDNVEQQHQSGVNDEETEKSDAHLKEESESDRKRDGEETKQDENANLSEPDYENMDTKESNNIQENIKEVIVVSSLALAQSTTPTAADSDNTPLTLERSTALSDHHNDDKHPNTDDNTDLSAADGDNGNTEEASKASEEGASVLLKPQAQSEQPEPLNEADKAGEKDTVIEETAEVLAREDLVTNWVTMHQTSKFFETFVEPLEDLKEGTSDGDSKEEVTPPAELQRSVSPQEKSETEEQEHTPKDVKGDEEKSKEGSVELDVESTGERDKEKEALQEKEETEVQDLVLKTESERAEDLKERQGSLEGATTQENTDQADVSNTIVESIDCATPSVISGRPESEDKTSHDAEMNEKQATDLSLLKTEEQPQQSPSPDFKDQGDTLEKSQEVTEISEFTESRSEDGVQKEPRHEDIKPKVSDANINGERKDLELIHDIKHTLSKERLSTLSVDETLFAPSSYPLLAAAQTESGH